MEIQDVQNIKEIAIEFIESLAIPYTSIILKEEEGRIWVSLIPQEDISRYIGYRGQNIGAMQQLFTLLLWSKGVSRDFFIVFDIDGYKKKNEEKIIEIIDKKISVIDSSGESQTMPFLGPQERRFVHLQIIQKYPDYETESFTDEKNKRVLRISKTVVQESLL